jgi:hypothetical protein
VKIVKANKFPNYRRVPVVIEIVKITAQDMLAYQILHTLANAIVFLLFVRGLCLVKLDQMTKKGCLLVRKFKRFTELVYHDCCEIALAVNY